MTDLPSDQDAQEYPNEEFMKSKKSTFNHNQKAVATTVKYRRVSITAARRIGATSMGTVLAP
jgi:hypothetical protein